MDRPEVPRRRARHLAAPAPLALVRCDHDATARRWLVRAGSSSGQGAYLLTVSERYDADALSVAHCYEPGAVVCLADANSRDCRHQRAALLLVLLGRERATLASLQGRAALHPASAAYYSSLIDAALDAVAAREQQIAALGFVVEGAA
jgi:hypothetical protein